MTILRSCPSLPWIITHANNFFTTIYDGSLQYSRPSIVLNRLTGVYRGFLVVACTVQLVPSRHVYFVLTVFVLEGFVTLAFQQQFKNSLSQHARRMLNERYGRLNARILTYPSLLVSITSDQQTHRNHDDNQ